LLGGDDVELGRRVADAFIVDRAAVVSWLDRMDGLLRHVVYLGERRTSLRAM
jgi:hypothetical protein